jgi:mRNA interferase MazF
MGAPAIREVVLVPFPYSNHSQTKVRPALCLANGQRGDSIFCQITSSPYGDATAISIDDNDFEVGGLSRHSFARPWILSPIHESIIIRVVGKLRETAFQQILDQVINHFRRSA